jgi:hypothetical protein
MNFLELITKINNENVDKREVINNIVSNIDITKENFNLWVDRVFSEDINKFDMSKLPYLIDELYKSNDELKFMLCCMIIESTCDKLSFITNLEIYPIVEAKFNTILNTLVTVYDHVDNGIANCMALILIKNDPKLNHLDDEQKNTILNATRRKLNDIFNYLKTDNINPTVFFDLEVIVDLSCYLNDSNISNLISKIDELGDNQSADLYIIKYKIINNMNLNENKINMYSKDDSKVFTLYRIMEELGVQDKYLTDTTQEQLAIAEMKRWLSYPNELGSDPDMIELLGQFTFNEQRFFAYKFMKNGFPIEGELLGVSGGYPLNRISSIASGYTFSKFEMVEEDWRKQALDLVKFISNYWKERTNNK